MQPLHFHEVFDQRVLWQQRKQLTHAIFCLVFWWTEIRNQLVEQFKCLEQQSESRIQLLQELQEFFRRKAEIELEYSRSLEKLAERFSSKIRSSREHQQFKWVPLKTQTIACTVFVRLGGRVQGRCFLSKQKCWPDDR